jgi:acetyltransferase
MGSLAQSAEIGKRIRLRNGSTVSLRPLVAGDEAAIADWFAGLGPETRYARFLATVTRLDHRTQAELARVDHHDHEAVVAVAPDGTTIGIARYMRSEESDTAEVAVAIADSWRRLGIATMLLQDVATRARVAGIAHLTAVCMATNDTVIRLLSRLGPTTISAPDAGVVELRIELRSTDATRTS